MLSTLFGESTTSTLTVTPKRGNRYYLGLRFGGNRNPLLRCTGRCSFGSLRACGRRLHLSNPRSLPGALLWRIHMVAGVVGVHEVRDACELAAGVTRLSTRVVAALPGWHARRDCRHLRRLRPVRHLRELRLLLHLSLLGRFRHRRPRHLRRLHRLSGVGNRIQRILRLPCSLHLAPFASASLLPLWNGEGEWEVDGVTGWRHGEVKPSEVGHGCVRLAPSTSNWAGPFTS